jgi:hypothetical protein
MVQTGLLISHCGRVVKISTTIFLYFLASAIRFSDTLLIPVFFTFGRAKYFAW